MSRDTPRFRVQCWSRSSPKRFRSPDSSAFLLSSPMALIECIFSMAPPSLFSILLLCEFRMSVALRLIPV